MASPKLVNTPLDAPPGLVNPELVNPPLGLVNPELVNPPLGLVNPELVKPPPWLVNDPPSEEVGNPELVNPLLPGLVNPVPSTALVTSPLWLKPELPPSLVKLEKKIKPR